MYIRAHNESMKNKEKRGKQFRSGRQEGFVFIFIFILVLAISRDNGKILVFRSLEDFSVLYGEEVQTIRFPAIIFSRDQNISGLIVSPCEACNRFVYRYVKLRNTNAFHMLAK